jgi:hypothetical protein
MTVEQEATATGDLRIEVNVRHNRTMSQYRLKKNCKLTFRNASSEGSLVVKPKRGSPFVDDCGAALIQVTVPPGCEVTVGINPSFKDNEFLYSAQIGNHEKEDPIVILE